MKKELDFEERECMQGLIVLSRNLQSVWLKQYSYGRLVSLDIFKDYPQGVKQRAHKPGSLLDGF
jgi:hypothetical protein